MIDHVIEEIEQLQHKKELRDHSLLMEGSGMARMREGGMINPGTRSIQETQ